MTELNISSNYMTIGGMSGVVALADAIPDMRALSSLVMKDNKLLTAEAGKILSEMLATNTVLKELDLSSNNWKQYGTAGDLMGDGPGFAQELAVGISDNGAISLVGLSLNGLGRKGALAICDAFLCRYCTFGTVHISQVYYCQVCVLSEGDAGCIPSKLAVMAVTANVVRAGSHDNIYSRTSDTSRQ
jgi:hypothetical protein